MSALERLRAVHGRMESGTAPRLRADDLAAVLAVVDAARSHIKQIVDHDMVELIEALLVLESPQQ